MERNERIDFYKAMLMLGVVWGHCITNLLVGDDNTIGIHVIVRTYDMPMFMLISGYFLAFSMEKRTWSTLVKEKVMRIALPMIFWGLLICKGKVINVFDCFYFLSALFLSSIVVLTIGKINKLCIQIITFIFVTIVLNFIPLYLWNLSYLFPYFVLGYLANVNKVHNPSSATYGGGIFLWIISLCFWDKSFSIWNTGTYFKFGITSEFVLIVAFRYFIALVGALAFVKICDILYDYFQNRRKAVFDIFVNSGKETLMIYILHVIPLIVINKMMIMIKEYLGYNPLNLNELLLGYVIAPILAISLIFMITWVLRYVKRYQYSRIVCGYKN